MLTESNYKIYGLLLVITSEVDCPSLITFFLLTTAKTSPAVHLFTVDRCNDKLYEQMPGWWVSFYAKSGLDFITELLHLKVSQCQHY